jgi:hypothetical protein
MPDREAVMIRVHQFLTLAQHLCDVYMEAQFPSLPRPSLIIAGGMRYLKIQQTEIGGSAIRPEMRRSAWCFIDLANGDILKPKTWKAPAKHARGNIFADDFGMSCIGPYGPNYMGEKPYCKDFCNGLLRKREEAQTQTS